MDPLIQSGSFGHVIIQPDLHVVLLKPAQPQLRAVEGLRIFACPTRVGTGHFRWLHPPMAAATSGRWGGTLGISTIMEHMAQARRLGMSMYRFELD